MPRKTDKGPAAYRDTDVDYMKSQAQIGKLLEKHGIIDSQFTTLGSEGKLVLQFKRPSVIEGQSCEVGVRIEVPNLTAKNRNQLHRALYHWLKTKFESLEFGFVEFEQEFFAHLVIPGPGNRPTTIYELLGPGYRQGVLTGQVQELQLLPGGGDR